MVKTRCLIPVPVTAEPTRHGMWTGMVETGPGAVRQVRHLVEAGIRLWEGGTAARAVPRVPRKSKSARARHGRMK